MSKEAREQALKLLSVKMRCEREVREQLRRKGYSSADIADAIEYLYRFDYLDDLKYCEAFIHDRLNFNPCGRLKLLYDLQQKGIERQRAEEAVEAFLPAETERAIARRLWAKKAQQATETDKIKRYLSGKGFETELINSLDNDG